MKEKIKARVFILETRLDDLSESIEHDEYDVQVISLDESSMKILTDRISRSKEECSYIQDELNFLETLR